VRLVECLLLEMVVAPAYLQDGGLSLFHGRSQSQSQSPEQEQERNRLAFVASPLNL
jgi:hypothetical protein